MLSDLIKKPQKTEPTSILVFRRFIIVLSLLLLIATFAILCLRMFDEKPSITSDFVAVDSIPAPAIILSFDHLFTISCSVYYDYHGTNAESCDEFITQPIDTGAIEHGFVGNFMPKDMNLKYYGHDDSGPYFVFLHISVNDPAFNLATVNDSAQESDFRMIAFDVSDLEDIRSKSQRSSFETSLSDINKYALTGGFVYKLEYSRKIRKALVQSPSAYIGFPKDHITKPYIASIMQNVPVSSTNTDYLTIRINPRTFVVEEEHEQRHDTFISILANIGAFYSVIVLIYVFLFGVESMRPWGFIHYGCCGLCGFKKRTKRKLANNMNTSSNNEDLEQRIMDLEKFKHVIEGNVIDISLIGTE